MGVEDATSGNRRRWNTARERDRLRARYEIRSRLSLLAASSAPASSSSSPLTTSTSSSTPPAANNGDGGDSSMIFDKPINEHESSTAGGGCEAEDSPPPISSADPSSSSSSSREEESRRCGEDVSQRWVRQTRDIVKLLRAVIKNDASVFSTIVLAGCADWLDRPMGAVVHPPGNTSSGDNEGGACGGEARGGEGVTRAKPLVEEYRRLEEEFSLLHSPLVTAGNQPYGLAASKYGVPYAVERVLSYLESSGRGGLTLLEYASLLGRHGIVGLILLGGADPTVRGGGIRCNGGRCGSGDALGGGDTIGGLGVAERATALARRRVLASFHSLNLEEFDGNFEAGNGEGSVPGGGAGDDDDRGSAAATASKTQPSRRRRLPPTPLLSMPISMWCHLVRSAVEMRMNGVVPDGDGVKASAMRQLCEVRQCGDDASGAEPPLLRFGLPCRHSFCEPCLWTNLLDEAGRRTDGKDVVRCPVCGAVGEEGFVHAADGDLNRKMQREERGKRQKEHQRKPEAGGGNGTAVDKEEKTETDRYRERPTRRNRSNPSAAGCTPQYPEERQRLESLVKFLDLPAGIKDLKERTRRAKDSRGAVKDKYRYRRERDPIHSTWEQGFLPTFGKCQEVRTDRLFKAVGAASSFSASSGPHVVRAILGVGVDVRARNTYGQTPLYVACWGGSFDSVEALLNYGSDPTACANGGSDCLNVARKYGHRDVVDLLLARMEPRGVCDIGRGGALVATHNGRERRKSTSPAPSFESDYNDGVPRPRVTFLIDPTLDHPGAGACTVDGAISDSDLDRLEALWRSLPVADPCETNEASSESRDSTEGEGGGNNTRDRPSRSYFCDAEGELQSMLAGCVGAVREVLASPISNKNDGEKDDPVVSAPKSLFPHVRFLHYDSAGGYLPPHVDLCRVDSKSGQRSTHTFILYLTNCDCGGGTALLKSLVDPKIFATTESKRGRALMFPHQCPHMGLEVKSAPKVLLRGEVIF